MQEQSFRRSPDSPKVKSSSQRINEQSLIKINDYQPVFTGYRIRLIACLDFFVYNSIMVTLNTKTKKVAVAAFLLAFFTFLSRVLGMLRNNLLGNIFPAEKVDIYLAAFRIPDLVYGLLITGGIVAAFLPVFSSYFKKSDKEP